MDEQSQDNQLEPTYSSSQSICDVALKTICKQWTIEKGCEKGSEISVMMIQSYMYIYAYIHMYIYVYKFFFTCAYIYLTNS